MKNHFFPYRHVFAAVALGLILAACTSDEWDKHYNTSNVVLADKTLSECIKSQPELSKFYQLMERCGYDVVLNGSLTYTVWAPNNDALSAFDPATMDTLNARKIVENHISLFSYPTSGLTTEKIHLLSNKLTTFHLEGSSYLFGENRLVEKNTPAKNGILHTLSGYEPYNSNLWEYMDLLTDIDSVKNYFLSQIVTDDFGETTNYLYQYAKLDNEDSTYTVLIPSNKAWRDALERIQPYFKFYDNTAGYQLLYSKAYIIHNLFFSRVKDPYLYDSIVSTVADTFGVNNLFMGATKYQASNGALFKTDTLRVAANESWQKRIVVEAEWANYGRTSTNANLFFRNALGSGFEASGDKYITLDPTSVNDISKVRVMFPIPNVLSATYDIYCVMMPERIANAVSPKPNVVNFSITYRKANGIYQPTSFTTLKNNVVTSADTVTNVYLGRVTFPWCSLAEGANSLEVIVRAENAVLKKDVATKSRTMRIDCVIFDPVQ